MPGLSGAELVRLSGLAKQRLQEAKAAKKLPEHLIQRLELLDSVAALPSTPRGPRVNLAGFLERKKVRHDQYIAEFETSRLVIFNSVQSSLTDACSEQQAALTAAEAALLALIASFDGSGGLAILDFGTASLARIIASLEVALTAFNQKTGIASTDARKRLFGILATLTENLTAAAHWEQGQVDGFTAQLTLEINSQYGANIADFVNGNSKNFHAQVTGFAETAARRFAQAEEAWRQRQTEELVKASSDRLFERREFGLQHESVRACGESIDSFLRQGAQTRRERVHAEIAHLPVEDWTVAGAETMGHSNEEFEVERHKILAKIQNTCQNTEATLVSGIDAVLADLQNSLAGIKVQNVNEKIGEIFFDHVRELQSELHAGLAALREKAETQEQLQASETRETLEAFSKSAHALQICAAERAQLAAVLKERVATMTAANKAREEEDERVLSELKTTLLDCVHLESDLAAVFGQVVDQLARMKTHMEENASNLVELRRKELGEFRTLAEMQIGKFDFLASAVHEVCQEFRTRITEYLSRQVEAFCASLSGELTESEVRMLDVLSRRLAVHAFRKGKCELEWLRPKEASILSHKKAFERHITGVKKFFYSLKSGFVAAYDRGVEAEQRLAVATRQTREQLEKAASSGEISACERVWKTAVAAFEAAVAAGMKEMGNCVRVAELEAVKRNEDFRRVMETNSEYSVSEKRYYGSLVDALVQETSAEAEKWRGRLAEFEIGAAAIPESPSKNFEGLLTTKKEELAARLGLGRKHGAPRQAAQEKVSSLLVSLATAKNNAKLISEEYLVALGATFTQGGPEVAQYWWRAVDGKTKFSGCSSLSHPLVKSQALPQELLLASFLFVRTSYCLLSSLNLIKDDKKAIPTPAIFANPAILADLAGQVAPGLTATDKADAKFEQIKANFDKLGKEFMTAYFERARASFNKFKEEVASELVHAVGTFRDRSFRAAVVAAFGFMRTQATEELRSFCERAEAALDQQMVQLEKQRAAHEKRMSPFLANPLNAEALEELKAEEERRAQRHAEIFRNFEIEFSGFIEKFEREYLGSLSQYFGDFFALIDFLPLVPQIHGAPDTLLPRPDIQTLIQKSSEGKVLDLTGKSLEQTEAKQLPKNFGAVTEGNSKISVSAAHADLVKARDEAFQTVETEFLKRRNSGRGKLEQTRQLHEYNGKVWHMMLADLEGNLNN